MRSRESAPKGSNRFMILSLLAMAAALGMVGMEMAKSRSATPSSATTSAAEPAPTGFVDSGPEATEEPAPVASEPGSGAPQGSAGTNPEAIRNQ